VNSVVFTVKATDADEDTLLYVIDTSLVCLNAVTLFQTNISHDNNNNNNS